VFDGDEPSGTLTPRQHEVLDVIVRYAERNGYPPSVRELGDLLDVDSTSTVHSLLLTLHRKGYIQRIPNTPRGIRVVHARRPLDDLLDLAAAVVEDDSVSAALRDHARMVIDTYTTD
jgi:repressor LexA